MRTLQEFLNEQLQDTEFQREYKIIQLEMDAIRCSSERKYTEKSNDEKNMIDIPNILE